MKARQASAWPYLRAAGAICACLAAATCAGKDWDFDRAQYRVDARIDDLRGPVRAMNQYYAVDGRMQSAFRTEFDAEGNRTRDVSVSYRDGDCYERTYVNSAAGDRVKVTMKSGKSAAGGVGCRDARVVQVFACSHEFNARGAMTSATCDDESPGYRTPRSTTRYDYDSRGRLTRVTYPQPAFLDYMAFSYADDPRGTKITRRAFGDRTNVKIDVTTEFVYATDGRLLETTQSPPGTIYPPGNGTYAYDDSGRLIRSSVEDVTTTYENFDQHGNWTVGNGSKGLRVTRSFEY